MQTRSTEVVFDIDVSNSEGRSTSCNSTQRVGDFSVGFLGSVRIFSPSGVLAHINKWLMVWCFGSNQEVVYGLPGFLPSSFFQTLISWFYFKWSNCRNFMSVVVKCMRWIQSKKSMHNKQYIAGLHTVTTCHHRHQIPFFFTIVSLISIILIDIESCNQLRCRPELSAFVWDKQRADGSDEFISRLYRNISSTASF